MAYNKITYRINYLGEKIYCNVDETPKTDHVIELICDKCGHNWNASTSNWLNRKRRPAYIGEICIKCLRTGEGNPSFGKDRSTVMAYARQFQKVNGMSGNYHTPETKALMSKSKVDLIAEGKFDIKSCNRGRKAYYVSTKSNIQFHADSILELARMIELDNDVNIKTWTKHHGIRIPYLFEDRNHNYVPDFLLKDIHGNTILEEVKGRIDSVDIQKEQQAIKYCQENEFLYRMITSRDLADPKNYKKLLKEIK